MLATDNTRTQRTQYTQYTLRTEHTKGNTYITTAQITSTARITNLEMDFKLMTGVFILLTLLTVFGTTTASRSKLLLYDTL